MAMSECTKVSSNGSSKLLWPRAILIFFFILDLKSRWIYCDVKSTLNVSVSITIIRTLISGKLFTPRWMLIEIIGANKMYTTKRYKRAHGVLNLKVLSTCLARGKIFENVGFFKGREKSSRLLKKYANIGKFSSIQLVLKSSMLDIM